MWNSAAIGVFETDDVAGECRARQAHARELRLMRNLDAGAVAAWQKKRIAGLDHRFAPV